MFLDFAVTDFSKHLFNTFNVYFCHVFTSFFFHFVFRTYWRNCGADESLVLPRLELGASRLLAARSSQLSYRTTPCACFRSAIREIVIYKFQRRAPKYFGGFHSSAGQSVRLLTSRPRVRASLEANLAVPRPTARAHDQHCADDWRNPLRHTRTSLKGWKDGNLEIQKILALAFTICVIQARSQQIA